MKAVLLSVLAALAGLAELSSGQTSVSVPRVNVSPQRAPASVFTSVTGYPSGPSFISPPTISTPATDAMARQNAWNAYNAQLHEIPTAGNPNRLAPRDTVRSNSQGLTEAPVSRHRRNFQFSDDEIRSVQKALQIRGIYPGQVDGILGPDTRRALRTYQSQNKLPVTGQPDVSTNAMLGIF